MKHLFIIVALLSAFSVMAEEDRTITVDTRLKVEKVSCTFLGKRLKIKTAGLPADIARLGIRGLKTSKRIKDCREVRDELRRTLGSRNNTLDATLTIDTRIRKEQTYHSWGHRGGGFWTECLVYKYTTVKADSDSLSRDSEALTVSRTSRVLIDQYYGRCRN